MSQSKLAVQSAIAGLIAIGLSAAAAEPKKLEMEKCAGIVKAGKNDCGTAKNSCAGTSKVDRDKDAWIELPKGTCDKIVGARVVK